MTIFALDGLVGIGTSPSEFVFVFYLHRELCSLFVRLSQLLGKRTPLPDDLVFRIFLVYLRFAFSPVSAAPAGDCFATLSERARARTAIRSASASIAV
jgi:hypothetical protein